jgi:hypothetical protein
MVGPAGETSVNRDGAAGVMAQSLRTLLEL